LPFLKKVLPAKYQKHLPVDVIKNWDWLKGLHRVHRSYSEKCDVGGKTDDSNGLAGGEVEQRGVNYLYTNRGLATHPPLRFNCNPEITIFELIPA
jgi:hypothetical protein